MIVLIRKSLLIIAFACQISSLYTRRAIFNYVKVYERNHERQIWKVQFNQKLHAYFSSFNRFTLYSTVYYPNIGFENDKLVTSIITLNLSNFTTSDLRKRNRKSEVELTNTKKVSTAFKKSNSKISSSYPSRESKSNLISSTQSPKRHPDQLYELTKAMLLKYKELNGHLMVPKSFIIPYNDEKWPTEMWGKKLGNSVRNIRNRSSFKSKRSDLESIGFVFSVNNRPRHGYILIKSMLLKYKEIYGNMIVPTDFIIPYNTSSIWLPEMYGKPLGSIVSSIRKKSTYKSYHDELQEIGFFYDDVKPSYGWNIISNSLQTYKSIYGNLIVKQSFVIPYNNISWPNETWGIPLGTTVNDIRNCGIYREHRQELEDIGFEFRHIKDVQWELLKHTLQAYADWYGDMKIPTKFVVPYNSEAFHKDSWGMRLGYLVTNIRNKGYWKSKSKELIEMGFLFGNQKEKN